MELRILMLRWPFKGNGNPEKEIQGTLKMVRKTNQRNKLSPQTILKDAKLNSLGGLQLRIFVASISDHVNLTIFINLRR